MTAATDPLDALALRKELPLFPLQTVLFPDGSISLQIFEVRYLDLIGRCYKTGAPFGVVALHAGTEVRQPLTDSEGFVQEEFADVGTLATISEFRAVQAGLMLIRCTGGKRFRIQARKRLRHGLWVADTQDIAPAPHVPIPQDLLPLSHALARLLERQRGEAQAQEHLPVYPPYQFHDSGWVANRWGDLLNLPSAFKQSLMQLENPLLRLELVGDLLHNADAPPL